MLGGLPYGSAIPIACVILAVVHLFDAEARISKWVVGLATFASFNMPAAWGFAPMLTQLAVSVFVLVRG